MSDKLTLSPTGITELMLEAIAPDAVLAVTPEAELIEVVVRPNQPASPELIVEGDKARLVRGSANRVTLPPGIALTAEETFGDLRVKGFDMDLRIRTVNGDLRLEQATGRVTIESARADVRAEGAASLHINACEGDLRFSAGGDLDAEQIGGDLRVVGAAAVRAGRVNGNLWVEKLAGGLRVEGASGDMRLAELAGPAVLGQVRGDLRAASLAGGLSAGHVHGDTVLDGPFPSGEGYTVHTDGDTHIRLAAQDDVRLVVRAAGRIRASLPLTPTTDGTPTYSATLGEGKVRMVVTGGGDLRIEIAGGSEARSGRDTAPASGQDLYGDLSSLGDRIRKQVSASLSAAGINPDTGELNFGRGRATRSGSRGFQPPTPPERPKAPGVTDSAARDEQLAILRMLEEGQITPDEADALLRALGA